MDLSLALISCPESHGAFYAEARAGVLILHSVQEG